jgi:hypothetical protein
MYLCDRQLHDSMKILHVLQNPLLSSTGCVTSSFEYDEHQTRGRTFDYALVVQNDAGQVTGVKTHSVVMSGSIMYEENSKNFSRPDTARTTAMCAKMGPRRDSNPGPLTIYRTVFDGITRSKYRTWKQLVWNLNYRKLLKHTH